MVKKLEFYIKKYGEKEGNEKYKMYNKNKGITLEKYINKYGEIEGKKKYDEWKCSHKGIFNLQWFISKYGEIEGTKKYKEKNQKCAGSLNSFINRYGEIEGKKKYDEFRKKCIIKQEIKNNPNSGYNNRRNTTKIEYYLNKGYNEEEAKKMLKQRQNTSSLDKYIKKYGKDEGLRQYIKTNQKRGQTLENFKRLYGDIEGEILYFKHKEKYKNKGSKEWYIKKYGEDEGTKKYEKIQNKKLNGNFFKNSISKISTEFIEKLLLLLKEKNIFFEKIYYGKEEYMFFIHKEGIKIIKVDLYIKDLNLVIEFYGDFWHRNPKIYENILDDNKYKVWDYDAKRIKLLKEKYNCDVIIVWESEYKLNEKITIDNLIEKIIEKYGNN